MFSRVKRLIVLGVVLGVLLGGFVFGLTVLYPMRYNEIIRRYAEKFDLPVELVYAVIHTESRFRYDVVSPRGASGLMQVVRGTADWIAGEIGIENYSYDRIFEPEINIAIGAWYLRYLINRFDGEIDTALAAYNAGPTTVRRWLNNPDFSSDGRTLHTIPYGETKRYVERVNNAMPIYRNLINLLNGALMPLFERLAVFSPLN